MSIVLAKISKVDYTAGNADISIEEHGKQVIKKVPFLASIYEMPDVGDMVFAEVEKSGGRIGRGVILGKYYSKKNPPKQSGKGITVKEFSDGAYIKYDPATKELVITAEKIRVKNLTATSITADTVTADNL